MATEIKVPTLGESVAEATVAKWMKSIGDSVALDEPLVELETDKVTLEVNAPIAGTLSGITSDEGAEVEVGALLGTLEEGIVKPTITPVAVPERTSETPVETGTTSLSPAVRKLVEENSLDASIIQGTGKDSRLVKGDILAYLEGGGVSAPTSASIHSAAVAAVYPTRPAGPREEKVKMTRLRQMVASRLKEAQNTAAILTTFNEVDMTHVMAMRSKYKETFEKKHGIKIGFMSIFVKACVVALREFPGVNAEINGDEIIYKNYYDIGVAVGSPMGLVVPVLRDAEVSSFADIESQINDFGSRARDGKLTLEEMQGGSFTVTNGGIFGSLLSTPIINPPQSGILGMHKIQQRPIVMPDGSIEARPMMYLALSYDHRIVDGREAVQFLVRVKDCIEDPQRIMLDA
jgi:2-oxoglutarate dehydrogenase E2 component (dihydrolipoamide succinyltransferase)